MQKYGIIYIESKGELRLELMFDIVDWNDYYPVTETVTENKLIDFAKKMSGKDSLNRFEAVAEIEKMEDITFIR